MSHESRLHAVTDLEVLEVVLLDILGQVVHLRHNNKPRRQPVGHLVPSY